MTKPLITQLWENEEEFLKRSAEYYKSKVDDIARRIDYLNDKPFKFGQVVRVANTEIGSMLGYDNYKYGVVIGHSDLEADNDRSYYRIYQGPNDAYIGYSEDRLTALTDTDEVPEAFAKIDVTIYGNHQTSTSIPMVTFK